MPGEIYDTEKGLKNFEELLLKAKLERNELMPLVQNVYLGSNVSADEIKLIELDEKTLNNILEGKRYFKRFLF